MENDKTEKRTFIPVSVELRDRLKELKGKGISYERFIQDLINEKEHKEDPPTHSNDTRTHKTGIQDILEFIEQNNPTGITKQKIDEAIREYKGMDLRTIKKYEPEIIKSILSMGYKPHPKNNNLFLRYNMTTTKPEAP